MSSERTEVARMGVDEGTINPVSFEQDSSNAVEEFQVALGNKCHMFVSSHGSLRPSRVDDDETTEVPTLSDAAPENGMGDAEVRADEKEDIGQFQVVVAIGRRVESECLLVGRNGRSHALASVAVAMEDSHAELG